MPSPQPRLRRQANVPDARFCDRMLSRPHAHIREPGPDNGGTVALVLSPKRARPGREADREPRLLLPRILSCVAGHERRAGEFRSGPTSSRSSSQVIAAPQATMQHCSNEVRCGSAVVCAWPTAWSQIALQVADGRTLGLHVRVAPSTPPRSARTPRRTGGRHLTRTPASRRSAP
jgi:hypothetical protein